MTQLLQDTIAEHFISVRSKSCHLLPWALPMQPCMLSISQMQI